MTSWPTSWATLVLTAIVLLQQPTAVTTVAASDPGGRPVIYMPPRAYLLCWKGVCDPRVWAEMVKRTPYYNFGLGKRSPSLEGAYYDDDDNNDASIEQQMAPQHYDEEHTEFDDQAAEKRSKYSFGVGKKNTDESRRFNFGLGKRGDSSDHRFNFGLGKREIRPNAYFESAPEHDKQDGTGHTTNDSSDDVIDEERMSEDDADRGTKRGQSYSFGLGKRPQQTYNFGLGKRDRAYGFGLGKRDRAYGFGLGKRDRPYGFGLGKRDRPYGFGLGKRDRPYGFGLGKRDRPYGFGLGKRERSYGFGLGKKRAEIGEQMEYDYSGATSGRNNDDDEYEVKRANHYSFGLGKRSATSMDVETTRRQNDQDQKTAGVNKSPILVGEHQNSGQSATNKSQDVEEGNATHQ